MFGVRHEQDERFAIFDVLVDRGTCVVLASARVNNPRKVDHNNVDLVNLIYAELEMTGSWFHIMFVDSIGIAHPTDVRWPARATYEDGCGVGGQ